MILALKRCQLQGPWLPTPTKGLCPLDPRQDPRGQFALVPPLAQRHGGFEKKIHIKLVKAMGRNPGAEGIHPPPQVLKCAPFLFFIILAICSP